MCGTPRDGRFCEEDGYDFVLAPEPVPPSGPPPATASFAAASPAARPRAAPAASANSGPDPGGPASSGTATGWVVRVEADRRYYATVLAREGPDIAAVSFPAYYPSTEIVLSGAEVRIGRRRASGATPPPEIDLGGPPLDPGVSHLHAVLLAQPAGHWAVLDPGSTNGTTINYEDQPIAVDRPVPVAAGDRIHVGAYTTLVIDRV